MKLRERARPIDSATPAETDRQRPDVYLFNPFTEGRLAQGPSFQPPKAQAQLARDLENLPQFLGRQNDIVLIGRRPAGEFLGRLERAGFALPEFVAEAKISALAGRELGTLRPWAWGPDSVERLSPLFTNVTGEDRSAAQRFSNSIAPLYSKAWSAAFLRRFLVESDWANVPWLCPETEVGVAVDTLADALAAINAIRRGGHHRIVVKQALGLAGQSAIRLWEPNLLEPQRRWLARAVEGSRQLVVEPWLERELDFSAQLEMSPRGLHLCGFTGLINDRRGQFQANWAEPDHPHRLPTRAVALLGEPAEFATRLQRLYGDIFARLETELRRAGHVGPVGIDAFIYRAPAGECRLKPVVEINPRYTMGRLTVELMRRTRPGRCGQFRLVNRALARAEGAADFPTYARRLRERHPLRLEHERDARIDEGALCLNDPVRAQAWLATFRVGRTVEGTLA